MCDQIIRQNTRNFQVMVNLYSVVAVILALTTTTANAFLLEPDPGSQPHCVWYGRCGDGHNRGKLNCPYEQSAPRLTDRNALRILKNYCPGLYHGDDNTYTCCHPDQLVDLEKSISLPKSMLASCPSCLYNFLNNICQLTCSPQQSQFMWANMSAPYPSTNTDHSGIPEITIVISQTFAQGLFDSCIDKKAFFGISAMTLLCGTSVSNCTPQKWLTYLGSVGNGQAPFNIKYVLTDNSWMPPTWSKTSLEPLRIQAAGCDSTSPYATSVFGKQECQCTDCRALQPCGQHSPLPKDSDRRHYLDGLYGASTYATVTLKVQSLDTTWVAHNLPPPSVDIMMFTPIFNKDFLKMVLSLQQQVSNIPATVAGSTVTLSDLCLTPQGQTACVVESVLQYYQNSASSLDKVHMDEYNIFVLADYLDHFSFCSHYPLAPEDASFFNMSCQADFGGPMQPFMILDGYQNDEFQNATGLVITYVLKYPQAGDHASVLGWAHAVDKFVQSYNNPNMSVTYSWYQPPTHTRSAILAAVHTSETDAIVLDDPAPKQVSDSAPAPVVVVNQNAQPLLMASQGGGGPVSGPGYDIVANSSVANGDSGANVEAEDVVTQVDNSDAVDDAEDVTADADEGHCVWYGQCGSGWNSGRLNCPVTNATRNAPLLTDPKALDILKQYCPDLYHGDNNTRTCCDINQLTTFKDNLALPEQFLARCPACYHNFLNQICLMTCSPNHSRYLYANMTAPKPSGVSTDGIPSVTYVMTPKFAQDMYVSCKDVQMPSANDKAISVFCGRKAEKCSPFIWLRYMGSTGNGRAPFPILYDFTNTTIQFGNTTMYPLNVTNVRCNESYSNTTEACSCQDCAATCIPVPPPPPPKQPFKILEIDGPAFICGCIFLAFVIFFGVYVICTHIVMDNAFNSEQKDCMDEDYVNTSARSSSQQNLMGNGMHVSPSDISCFEKLGSNMEQLLSRGFTAWGTFCAQYPIIVLLVSLIVFGSLAGGIARYNITTDPVKLWSAKTSTARMQKDYFDSHFGPFYRTEQIIISRPNNHTRINHPYPPPSVESIDFSSLFDLDFMHQVLDLQTSVENIKVMYKGKNVTLKDICFKPLAPDYDDCTIQSVLQYWQNNRTRLDKVIMDQYQIFDLADHFDHFLACAQAPASVSDNTKLNMSCLGANGVPAFPWVVLGGYDAKNYQNSTAFVITFVVNNHLDEEMNGMAEAWEAEFIKLMKGYKNNNMTVSFSSERSIQDELDRESRSDVWTIVVSYLVMFVYITVTLGHFHSLCSTYIFVDSKITLGLSGVTIVLLSVAASVGFYSYAGVPMTLIIIEVVPFLVLAVGVDNIFILVQTFQRDEKRGDETLEEQVGRILGRVGPSMLLTSLSESVAFFLGALTDMPAVREFALYAAMAVLFDFILQVTAFISLMTLDAKRQNSNRFDILCCVKKSPKEKQVKSEGYLYYLVNNYYAPVLLTEVMRPIVILVFVSMFLFSIAFAVHLEIGLDQALSMPTDSFVLDYFHNLSTFLSVGAPVYFVVPSGFNYLSRNGQNEICGSKGCNQDSLIGQVFHASQLPEYSYIAQPASSWMDDYFDWINSQGNTPCCRINASGGFCPSTSKENCTQCPFEPQIGGRPTPNDFMKYLPMFLSDNPGLICAKGGHAAYASGVNLIDNKTNVGASYFMTYHTILKTSGDYINGLKEARRIAKNISAALGVLDTDQEVFPYSIFYVFYEQYLTIIEDTIKNVGICIASIFIVTFILLGFDIITASIVCLTIMMIVMNIMGLMYLWGIDLNALTLVNLVMAIGISVEFCSHIARAFAVSTEKDRVTRAKDALAHMGSSVLSGITLTKLGGIIVLAFAKSQLFQVFYFRMYLGMVVYGATHGLIFLPVLLSYIGPGINKAKLYQEQQNGVKNSSSLARNDQKVAEIFRPTHTHL